jgi:hypothetical protein
MHHVWLAAPTLIVVPFLLGAFVIGCAAGARLEHTSPMPQGKELDQWYRHFQQDTVVERRKVWLGCSGAAALLTILYLVS